MPGPVSQSYDGPRDEPDEIPAWALEAEEEDPMKAWTLTPALEKEVLEAVFRNAPISVYELLDEITPRPSDTNVRKVLARHVARGMLRREWVFRPSTDRWVFLNSPASPEDRP
jgi:hypothetical protein